MKRYLQSGVGLLAIAAAGLLTPGPAFAQAAPAAESDGPVAGEITVTARKREESLLSVPVVATVITQAQIDRQQVLDLKDVAKFAPGLVLSQTLGVSGVQVSLRGIGTSATNAGIDASVALNLDGMQITQGIAYSSAMFDLGQIEVLRGPQALFFGKNSPGGVISIRSADPTRNVEVMARYGYEAEAREHRFQGVLSGPVSDDLLLRLAGQYSTLDGYFKRRATAAPGFGGVPPLSKRGSGGNSIIVRGTALWSPSDSFDARLKVNVSHDRVTGGVGLKAVSCPDGIAPIPPRNIPFLDGEDCKINRVVHLVDLDPASFDLFDKSGISVNETDQQFGTLELNFTPSDAVTLTSVTGLYNLKFTSQQASYGTAAAGGIASLVNPLKRRDFTQELRLNTDFDAPVNATIGAFYQDGKLENTVILPGNTAIGIAKQLSNYYAAIDIEAYSAFGQLRWKPMEQVEIAGGARYSHEKRSQDVVDLRGGVRTPFALTVPSITFNNVSPEVTVTYKPTGNLTLFAAYKQGFKSGSFDMTAPNPNIPDRSFGEEKVKGAEAGIKGRFLDGQLYADIAYYDYRYTGLQVGANIVRADGVAVGRTINAGSARSRGVDLNATFSPRAVEGLSLRGSLQWNRARFRNLRDVPCWGGQREADGCNQTLSPTTGRYTGQDLSGTPLQRAPEWQVNFGFDYKLPVGDGYNLTVSNFNVYSSRYLAVLGLRDDFYRPGYFKSDLTLALSAPDDRWEIALIGKNIGNKVTTGGCTNSNFANSTLGGVITGAPIGATPDRGAAGVDEVGCYLDRGREMWLRLTLRPF